MITNVVILIDEVNVYNGGRALTGQSGATQVALWTSDGTLVMPVQTNKVNYSPTQIQFDATHVQFEYVFPRTVGGDFYFVAGNFSAASFFRDSVNGARATPRSVMMAAMKRAGVTSNAG